MIETVILDLDNTLIYCPNNVANIPKSCFFLRHHHVYLEGVLHVIFERPFLHEFLTGLKGKRIAIWTAAHESYAKFIVKYIIEPYLDPQQTLEFVWSSEHCKESSKRYNLIKHLDMIFDKFPNISRSNTVIIDDNEELLQQKNKVYVIENFNLCDLDDVGLLYALKAVNG